MIASPFEQEAIDFCVIDRDALVSGLQEGVEAIVDGHDETELSKWDIEEV